MSAEGWDPLLFLALPGAGGGMLALWLTRRLLKSAGVQNTIASLAGGLSVGASTSIFLGWSVEPALVMSLLMAFTLGGGLLYSVWRQRQIAKS